MKKTTKLFGIAVFAAAFMALGAGGAHANANTFALPLSFGVSASFSGNFGGGVSGSVTRAVFNSNPPVPDTVSQFLDNDIFSRGVYTGMGGSIFFDAHFVQFSAGYFRGTLSSRDREATSIFTQDIDIDTSWIDISLLGKFPVELSPRITVFPLAGVAYRIMLTGGIPRNEITLRRDFGNLDHGVSFNPARANALWFRLGGGMDFSLSETMFLRGNFTYGIRLRNRWENDMIDNSPYARLIGINLIESTYDSARLGHGVDITVGIGFRLN